MSFAVHMGEQLSSPTDRATCPCLLQLCHQHVRVRHAPRPAPGADDETNERQLCPWEAAISRRNWLRNRPLNHSAIITSGPRHQGKMIQSSCSCGTPVPVGRDREQTDCIVTSKSKRMRTTGQRGRLTITDKAPSRNNFRTWALEPGSWGPNPDPAPS